MMMLSWDWDGDVPWGLGLDVLDDICATDALAVPVICSAVFELELHVLDALVDDPVCQLLVCEVLYIEILKVGRSSILLRSAFGRSASAGGATSCSSSRLAEDDSSRCGEQKGEFGGKDTHVDG